NNIANVNTYGFKASNTAFKTLLTQTMQGAGAPSPTLGGTNFQQVGLGMTIDSITQQFTQGALQTTGVGTDLAIQGDGFFMVTNDLAGVAAGAPEMFYTRAGNFKFDQNGTLVTSDGYHVMGWVDSDADPSNGLTFTTADPLSSIVVDPTLMSDPIIGPDGSVSVIDRDPANTFGTLGQRITIGMLSFSRFSNSSGLEQVGNNRWQESLNSGVPVTDVSNTNGMGQLSVGYLEMSNVDLATEFTEMIKAQRGFQANSRVITTSDEILQELVNLKR
ncbi:MAG: flagellar hook-basal body complex protein, partial [Thermoleophilia bacterium]|nr:flagellar hook-basal body complex protein [Thermoleophilia bacterium]